MNCLVGICEGTLCSMRLRVTRMLEPEFDPVSRDQESGGLTTGLTILASYEAMCTSVGMLQLDVSFLEFRAHTRATSRQPGEM
jgi:hypothetical protein